MSRPGHRQTAETLVELAADDRSTQHEDVELLLQFAQVHASIAQAAATERLAKAVENLPTYEGMLSVYNFGGGK